MHYILHYYILLLLHSTAMERGISLVPSISGCVVVVVVRAVCVRVRVRVCVCVRTSLLLLRFSLFTDLSVAGLPAELKHITQRRKRKQP